MDLQKVIQNSTYDFLRTEENLKDKLFFITLGGSQAYNLATPTSDIDLKGCCQTPISTLLGFDDWTQHVCDHTDTTIYTVNRFLKLLLDCNPSMIEIGYVRPQDRLIINPTCQVIFDNIGMFLTQKAKYTFVNYAMDQFNRALNSIARDNYTGKEKEEHIMRSIQLAMTSFNSRYTEMPEGSMKLYTAESSKEDIDYEMYIDVSLTKYPLRDFRNQMSEMLEIIKTYGKVNHRNKKPEGKLDKHLSCLVMNLKNGTKALEGTFTSVYQEGKDRDLLMDLRLGKLVGTNKDGSRNYDFIYDILGPLQTRFEYAAKNTTLPEKVDRDAVNEMLIGINKQLLGI